MISSKFIR